MSSEEDELMDFQDFKNSIIQEGLCDLKCFEGHDSKKFWEVIHSATNIKQFEISNSNLKVDLESNIPKMIKNNPELKSFRFYYFKDIVDFETKYFQQALENHKQVEGFGIFNRSIFNRSQMDPYINIDSILKGLENCMINNLTLFKTHINDSTLKCLKNIQSLNTLQIIGCNIRENISSINIESCKILKIRDIYTNQDSFYKFIKMFSNLKELKLDVSFCIDCSKLKDSLKGMKLNIFDLFNDFRNGEHLKDILDNLHGSFYIFQKSSDITDDFPFFSNLKDNNSLKCFKGRFQKKIDLKYLDIFMSNTKSLKSFTIKEIIGDKESLEILGKGISKNSSIEHLRITLDLSDGLNYITKGLVNNHYLTYLDISCSHLGDIDCSLIANYLRNNSSLKILDLSDNSFKEVGLKLICESLYENNSLESLFLELILFKNEGCESIEELLKKNIKLKFLYITDCSFDDIGLNYIGRGLLFNSSLIHIQCQRNNITFNGIEEFQNNLFYNQTILVFEWTRKSNKSKMIEWILNRNSSFVDILKVHKKELNIEFHFV